MPSLRSNIAATVLIAFALPAIAEDAAENAPSSSEAVAEVAETVLELDGLDENATLTDEELGSQRARENIEIDTITIVGQEQDGDVSDNVAIGNTNGDNMIDGEAFSNSSGFLSTVQNTGNNVLIQNSTIINVSVETSGE